MSGRTPRVIGTTEKAINEAEAEVGFQFPPSFRDWLIENNGLEIDGVHKIYSVLDERDQRKTWDSITRHFKDTWLDWIEIFEGYGEPFDFSQLFLLQKPQMVIVIVSITAENSLTTKCLLLFGLMMMEKSKTEQKHLPNL